MKRAERRAETEKVAKRRFKEVKERSPWLEPNETEGLYRKKNPFTFPKVPKRAWFKIQKEKSAALKSRRRNGDLDKEIE